MSQRFDRRDFLRGSLVAAAATQASAAAPDADAGAGAAASKGFALEEASLKSLQEAMASGKTSARALTTAYLARIDALNQKGPALRAFIEASPVALAEADALDQERKERARAGRCTEFPSPSKTTSTPRARCRPPPARWRWKACPRSATRRWWRGCVRRAR
jgi:hypothetical protein